MKTCCICGNVHWLVLFFWISHLFSSEYVKKNQKKKLCLKEFHICKVFRFAHFGAPCVSFLRVPYEECSAFRRELHICREIMLRPWQDVLSFFIITISSESAWILFILSSFIRSSWMFSCIEADFYVVLFPPPSLNGSGYWLFVFSNCAL